MLSVCAACLQVISLYTMWQLVHMHEMDGYRFNRYQELGQVRMTCASALEASVVWLAGLRCSLPACLPAMLGICATRVDSHEETHRALRRWNAHMPMSF